VSASRLFGVFVALSAPLALGAAAAAPPAQVELRTNAGVIRLELYPDKAPATTENFLRYVREGHYDGTIFHRVIAGFVVQGGGFDPAFRQKPTRAPIPNEAERALKAGLRNRTGTIAMARTADPHSATAQFFINLADNDFLDWGAARGDGHGYAVFGRVVAGMDVVVRIARTPTGPGGPFARDVPREPLIVEKALVLPAQ